MRGARGPVLATLFGSANVCYMIASDGELPAGLSRTEWKEATGGLILTAALVVVVTLLFDLSGIAMMGSANRGAPVWSKALPDEGFIYAAWH